MIIEGDDFRDQTAEWPDCRRIRFVFIQRKRLLSLWEFREQTIGLDPYEVPYEVLGEIYEPNRGSYSDAEDLCVPARDAVHTTFNDRDPYSVWWNLVVIDFNAFNFATDMDQVFAYNALSSKLRIFTCPVDKTRGLPAKRDFYIMNGVSYNMYDAHTMRQLKDPRLMTKIFDDHVQVILSGTEAIDTELMVQIYKEIRQPEAENNEPSSSSLATEPVLPTVFTENILTRQRRPRVAGVLLTSAPGSSFFSPTLGGSKKIFEDFATITSFRSGKGPRTQTGDTQSRFSLMTVQCPEMTRTDWAGRSMSEYATEMCNQAYIDMKLHAIMQYCHSEIFRSFYVLVNHGRGYLCDHLHDLTPNATILYTEELYHTFLTEDDVLFVINTADAYPMRYMQLDRTRCHIIFVAFNKSIEVDYAFTAKTVIEHKRYPPHASRGSIPKLLRYRRNIPGNYPYLIPNEQFILSTAPVHYYCSPGLTPNYNVMACLCYMYNRIVTAISHIYFTMSNNNSTGRVKPAGLHKIQKTLADLVDEYNFTIQMVTPAIDFVLEKNQALLKVATNTGNTLQEAAIKRRIKRQETKNAEATMPYAFNKQLLENRKKFSDTVGKLKRARQTNIAAVIVYLGYSEECFFYSRSNPDRAEIVKTFKQQEAPPLPQRHFVNLNTYCEPCQMEFTTANRMEAHVRSPKHAVSLELSKLKDPVRQYYPHEYSVCQDKIHNSRFCFVCCTVLSPNDEMRHWKTNPTHLDLVGKRDFMISKCIVCALAFSPPTLFSKHRDEHHNGEPKTSSRFPVYRSLLSLTDQYLASASLANTSDASLSSSSSPAEREVCFDGFHHFFQDAGLVYYPFKGEKQPRYCRHLREFIVEYEQKYLHNPPPVSSSPGCYDRQLNYRVYLNKQYILFVGSFNLVDFKKQKHSHDEPIYVGDFIALRDRLSDMSVSNLLTLTIISKCIPQKYLHFYKSCDHANGILFYKKDPEDQGTGGIIGHYGRVLSPILLQLIKTHWYQDHSGRKMTLELEFVPKSLVPSLLSFCKFYNFALHEEYLSPQTGMFICLAQLYRRVRFTIV
jgi:hypothetical protein